MYILSQDKTRIYNMSGHIEGIGYEESKDYKQRKTENIRHTIQVFDGCAEEIAEFKTKEDCMLVIYAIFKGMEGEENRKVSKMLTFLLVLLLGKVRNLWKSMCIRERRLC